MLFNSPIFLLVFLPITLGGFYLLGRLWGRNAALLFLLAACLVFYAYSSLFNFALFLVSVVVNFFFGYAIAHFHRSARTWLIGGIVLNLALIGYFKYTGLIISSIDQLFSASFVIPTIALPVGISFYTFEQISYLIETRQRKQAESSLARYTLFVSFFPHLIAGPIIRPHQLLPQFSAPTFALFSWQNFALGISFLLFGLFKKTIIADSMAAYATPVFASAASGGTPGFFNAWGAALAYTFQIYFDFSGYSDMAIGLGLMFGVVLPFNFNSPYKATSIIEFWRRWHITLSLFLRDYVYIPLGGNRSGPARRYVNVMLTMLIGGLWHGASWTFVAWGGLHGLFLLVNHAWRNLRGEREVNVVRQWIARVATFLLVVLAWVFFRAESFDAAHRILDGMRGMNGWLHGPLLDAAPGFSEMLKAIGIIAEDNWLAGGLLLGWFVAAFAIVWGLPNTQQFLLGEGRSKYARLAWRPTLGWAAALGLLFGVAFTYNLVAVCSTPPSRTTPASRSIPASTS